jgi:hypothetical protein
MSKRADAARKRKPNETKKKKKRLLSREAFSRGCAAAHHCNKEEQTPVFSLSALKQIKPCGKQTHR